MPINQALINTIDLNEKRGASAEDIINAMSVSKKFPDIAAIVKQNLDAGAAPEDILSTIKSKAPSPTKINTKIPSSTVQLLGAGVGKGMVDIGRGVGERLGLVTPEQIAEARKWDQPLMETTPGKIGNIIGSTVPFMAIPGGAGAGFLGRAGVAAATGAGMGLIQPTVEGESPIVNAGIGAVIGPTTAVGLSGAGKIYNAIKSPVMNEIAILSRKYGIRATLGEIKKSPLWQKAETWLEQIPIIGLKGFREKGQVETQQAARSFLGQYIVNPASATTQAMKEANDFSLMVSLPPLDNRAQRCLKLQPLKPKR